MNEFLNIYKLMIFFFVWIIYKLILIVDFIFLLKFKKKMKIKELMCMNIIKLKRVGCLYMKNKCIFYI